MFTFCHLLASIHWLTIFFKLLYCSQTLTCHFMKILGIFKTHECRVFDSRAQSPWLASAEPLARERRALDSRAQSPWLASAEPLTREHRALDSRAQSPWLASAEALTRERRALDSRAQSLWLASAESLTRKRRVFDSRVQSLFGRVWLLRNIWVWKMRVCVNWNRILC